MRKSKLRGDGYEILHEYPLLHVCHGYPSFKVQYKFNPPDDRRSEDLVHEFITHVEPENHYCVGDPLPILYKIEDKYFFDEVYSMPYPVPLDDMTHLTYLVDMSSSKRDETVQEIVEMDWNDLHVPHTVSYFLKANKYSCAMSMLAYHVKKGDYSYENAKNVVYKLWNSDNTNIQKECMNCLFDIAFSSDVTECDKFKPLKFVAKLLAARPIPAGMMSILQQILVKISCSYMYNNNVESYDSYDFDVIWDSLIELFVDPILTSDLRLKIIDVFKYCAVRESAFKLYRKFDEVDFENKN